MYFTITAVHNDILNKTEITTTDTDTLIESNTGGDDNSQVNIYKAEITIADTDTLIESNTGADDGSRVIIKDGNDTWSVILRRRAIAIIVVTIIFVIGLILRFVLNDEVLKNTNSSQPFTEMPTINVTGTPINAVFDT